MSRTPDQQRDLLEDIVAHSLGLILVSGFFVIILASLLGFVDITDPAITAFVGTALGYAAAKLDPVIGRYFRNGINPADAAENQAGDADDKPDP